MVQVFDGLHWWRDLELAEYLVPASLEEALEMLARYGGRARVVAGGTDVVPALRRREYQVEALVDITRLPGLDRIEQQGRTIHIGALVTHAQAAASTLLRERAGLLARGCGAVGSPQIRNVGTLAGNLVSGQPAADASIPLLALGAEVTVVSAQGQRRLPLGEFFLDLGRTALDPGREILTRISFPALGPGQGGSFQRLAKRKALTLPMLVCAVKVSLDESRRVVREAAVALGPVAPVPWREPHCEEFLRGAPVNPETIGRAAELAAEHSDPRDSLLRGSRRYRQEMVKVLVRRALEQACVQAGGAVE